MGSPAWRRPKEVFQAALERPPEARLAFLDEACGADDDLRREVESLLAAHERAGAFLSRPAILDAEHGERDDDRGPPVAERIGPYRILDAIAQGGMGTVYRAVRADDAFRKTVALKLVRGGFGGGQLERRFRREREILGRLQHPNIATIFDGGTTLDGRSWLAMEYVEGVPITEYCDARGLGTRDRIELFRTVCAAVHYAHQNLVVHRDIKPANVLVDARGVPKLLDFGIAKLLAAGLDPDDAPTATMLPAMTPEYASPEQVKGERITTATDVYSLGVLLYELLAGRRPYPVRTDSLDGIVRAVCETEPRAPSEARVRAAELRGDLDTIVLKALRKEPERRYLSALELSEDLRRHLEGLPVAARADTLGYRTGKFVRRHRGAVFAAGLVLLSLLGGIVATARQARIAEASRRRAEQRFADVRALASSLLFDIHDQIRELPGATRVRERLVATAQQYLDDLAREAAGEPELQRELAAAYERLGDVQGGGFSANLGNTEGALDSYKKASAIRESFAARAAPGSPDDVDLARLELRRGTLLRGMGRLSEAESSYRQAAERLEAGASAVGATDVRQGLLAAYSGLASVQIALGRAAESAPALRKAIEHGESLVRDHPENTAAQGTLANAYYQASLEAAERAADEEALGLVRRARALQESLLARDDLDQSIVRGLLFSLNGEGLRLEALGRLDEAIELYRRALEIALEMLARDPSDRWASSAVTVAYNTLGRALIAAGDAPGALEPLREARRIGGRVLEEDPANGFVRNELAVVDSNLGFALLAAGIRSDPAEACRSFERAAAGWRELQQRGELPAESADALRRTEAELARCGGGGS